jgi:ferric-dicitrate binding protein FerR (iron transport regulator)
VRRVYLSGEAYADIAKDQMRRFIVSADQIDVVVHGTRFNIRSYESNSEVELLLLEGSIDMQTKSLKENRVVRMYPGNLVKLDKLSGRIICDNIPSDMFDDDPAARNLTFVNSRLGDIASQLERLFDVRIVIDQASLADERYYSAFVNNESLDRILSTLEQNGTMSYYWRGGEIHLRKK